MTETDTANKDRSDKCKILRDSLIEHAVAEAKQIGIEHAVAAVALAEAALIVSRNHTPNDLAFSLSIDALTRMMKGMCVSHIVKPEGK